MPRSNANQPRLFRGRLGESAPPSTACFASTHSFDATDLGTAASQSALGASEPPNILKWDDGVSATGERGWIGAEVPVAKTGQRHITEQDDGSVATSRGSSQTGAVSVAGTTLMRASPHLNIDSFSKKRRDFMTRVDPETRLPRYMEVQWTQGEVESLVQQMLPFIGQALTAALSQQQSAYPSHNPFQRPSFARQSNAPLTFVLSVRSAASQSGHSMMGGQRGFPSVPSRQSALCQQQRYGSQTSASRPHIIRAGPVVDTRTCSQRPGQGDYPYTMMTGQQIRILQRLALEPSRLSVAY